MERNSYCNTCYSMDKLNIISDITFGSVVAMICSWSINHSIPYLIVHGILSWFYVIYWLWVN